MFSAFLRGEKSQTRRVIHPQPGPYDSSSHGLDWKRFYFTHPDGLEHLSIRPAYRPGEVVAIAAALVCGPDNSIRYRDNGELASHKDWNWKSKVLAARFCPLWCCRYSARITGVRVEQVGNISDSDALAEGITGPHSVGYQAYKQPGDSKARYSNPTAAYEYLWDWLHNVDGERFWDSPWVFVYSFEKSS